MSQPFPPVGRWPARLQSWRCHGALVAASFVPLGLSLVVPAPYGAWLVLLCGCLLAISLVRPIRMPPPAAAESADEGDLGTASLPVMALPPLQDSLTRTMGQIEDAGANLVNGISELSDRSRSQVERVGALLTSSNHAADSFSLTVIAASGEAMDLAHALDGSLAQLRATSNAYFDHASAVCLRSEALVQRGVLLQEQLSAIHKVSNLVKAIARQTGFVALNAAIEAARAEGSAGGFRIVADEFRKLAEQTAGAALHMQELTAGLEHSIRETMDAIVVMTELLSQQTWQATANDIALSEMGSNVASVTAAIEGLLAQTSEFSQLQQDVIASMTPISAEAQDLEAAVFSLFEHLQSHDICRQEIDHVVQTLQRLQPAVAGTRLSGTGV
jgi:methyl-accepting chemotaxis protein